MVVVYGCLYVEAAPLLQTRDTYNVYDWSGKKISYKISAYALDQLLLLFNDNNKKSTKIEYHSTNSVKAFSMKRNDDSLMLELQSNENLIQLSLSQAEAQGLHVLLTKAKERVYGW